MSMMVTGWDPFAELTNMQRTVDRLVGSAFGGAERSGKPSVAYLPVNLRETATAYELQTPVPGFTPEEIDVSFADGVLTISAEHKSEVTQGEGQNLVREFHEGSVQRRLALAGDVDAEHIQASIENGVLHLQLPKASRSLPRRIPIGGATSPNGTNSEPKLAGTAS